MNVCQQNASDDENKNLLSYEKRRLELDEKNALINAVIAVLFFSHSFLLSNLLSQQKNKHKDTQCMQF